MRAIRKEKKGFSLLEVMIAIAFVGIALTAVIRTQGHGIALSEKARFNSKGIFLARYLLSETQSQSNIQQGEEDGKFEGIEQDVLWLKEITSVPNLPGLFKIQVWVQQEGQPPREGLSLQGFVYRGER